MKQNLNKYDTSNYEEDNIYNMPLVNEKLPGVMKDEMGGRLVRLYVGIRSKMYCVKADNKIMKKAKGVKRYVLQKTITFDDYVNCLNMVNNGVLERWQNSIRSIKHQVFSVKQKKIALSSSDNKRYILEGNIETLPWGHYRVPNTNQN